MKRMLLLCCSLLLVSTAAAWAGVCEVSDNGDGTADLPPACPEGYLGDMVIVDGLPALTTIEIAATLHDFSSVVRAPGGGLGGEVQTWNAVLLLMMDGTGDLAGFSRMIAVPVTGEAHSGPRVLNDPVQSFPTDMFLLQGQIFGDPDFDLLRVTAGTGFGLPSPGHTTLTLAGGGNWNVDSFFDITYRIDFVGAPGSVLEGLSGSTTGTDRFQLGEQPVGNEPASWGSVKEIYRTR